MLNEPLCSRQFVSWFCSGNFLTSFESRYVEDSLLILQFDCELLHLRNWMLILLVILTSWCVHQIAKCLSLNLNKEITWQRRRLDFWERDAASRPRAFPEIAYPRTSGSNACSPPASSCRSRSCGGQTPLILDKLNNNLGRSNKCKKILKFRRHINKVFQLTIAPTSVLVLNIKMVKLLIDKI